MTNQIIEKKKRKSMIHVKLPIDAERFFAPYSYSCIEYGSEIKGNEIIMVPIDKSGEYYFLLSFYLKRIPPLQKIED